MRAYLSPVSDSDEVRRIVVESPVGIFRRAEDSAVVVSMGEDVVELGIADQSVSRIRPDGPPVALEPTTSGVAVRNDGSTNPVYVRTGFDDHVLERGESTLVDSHCTITVGGQRGTALHLTIEGDDDLSIEEYVEKLNLDRSGSLLGGVPVSAYVPLVVELLLKARAEGTSECLKYTHELRTVLREHPIENGEYDDLCHEVEHIETLLEQRIEVVKVDGLDPEHHARIDRIGRRVTRLYTKGMTV
ncbi:hypothetical protein [Salinigranum sp.]|uniref:hypothetical protein n=1 Tax=Salinigranum sp. TaxID=1966351 RepID=UPI0035672202